jgi:hypothetical protein
MVSSGDVLEFLNKHLQLEDLSFMYISAIPITGRGGPQGCETSRLPHFLDNRLRDGGEVVSLTRPAAVYPQEDFWYSFLLEAESTPES